ncbi:MAG TPA: hypothetical protein VLA42_07770 [Verrucomicrobiae bacterium]|nr:hypothetical protein [Verrucomicrobiae bacterium]
MPDIPTLLAFIVCDTVIQDTATQKRTLVGVFDRVVSPKVPLTINNLGLYAKLVEGSGSYDMRVRLVNLKDESPVMEIKATAQWSKPDEPLELGMNFAGIPLTEFGTYEFQLYANEVFVGRALIRADKLQLPPLGPVRGN